MISTFNNANIDVIHYNDFADYWQITYWSRFIEIHTTISEDILDKHRAELTKNVSLKSRPA